MLTPLLDSGLPSVNSCDGGATGKPCSDHSRKTRSTYADQLEALGCICRALVALGLESCCAPREPRSSTERKRGSRSSLRGPAKSAPSSQCVKACCAVPQSKLEKAPSIADSCAASCCEESPPQQRGWGTNTRIARLTTDPEKGTSGDFKEHVILSISGMTCTGCETKLIRTLASLPDVKNLKTSLVLARAEFDLAGTTVSGEVIKHLERTTEFKCQKVKNQGATIDIVAPKGNPSAFINRPWPSGVIDMTAVDKKTVQVCFDAKVIGARDLAQNGWPDGPVSLADPRGDPSLEAGGKHVRHLAYMTILSAVLTIPVLVLAWAPLPQNEIAYSSASLALATIVQCIIAGPFYPKALKSLIFSRVIEMDLLIVLSTSAAYIFSIVSFGYMVAHHPLPTGQFFETSTLLVTLIMVGRYLGALGRQKAVESISIRSLQVSRAVLVTEQGDKEIDARLLQYGDVFRVAPDSRVPTDGTVLSGVSEVDESMITGESRPILKQAKSPLIAGSVNGFGALEVRLTRLPGDNTISTIASIVDDAKLSKPKIQDMADKVASYFVPVVVFLAAITMTIWVAVGIKVQQLPGNEATIKALTYAITVLIVSCPCAIGLAVPMVVVIASGVAAERGVIFKTSSAIESAYKTSHVVFDKTGTLTEGKLTVSDENYLVSDDAQIKALLLGLVTNIKHPVSVALAAHLKSNNITAAPVSEVKAFPGKGVQGKTMQGIVLRAGNARWLGVDCDPKIQSMQAQGHTTFCFTIDDSLAAIFGFQDSIRSDSAATIASLAGKGISVHMLSGDDSGAVKSVANELGIPETNVRSRCSPAEKQAYIQYLLSKPTAGKIDRSREPVVVFCGDGTNDAVALAQATIGVHVNERGTDVAQSAADVVLMRPNLDGILTMIRISQISIHRIAFNFAWSFVYNLFAVLLAAGVFVKARIPPEFAGLGELVSVLPVIVAAMLLRWAKI